MVISGKKSLIPSFFSRCMIRFCITTRNVSVDVKNSVFNRLEAQKEKIEASFGAALIWLPLPDRKACRIQYSKPLDGYHKANWPEMIQWLVEHMIRLEQALSGPLEKIKQELKTTDLSKEPVQDAE